METFCDLRRKIDGCSCVLLVPVVVSPGTTEKLSPFGPWPSLFNTVSLWAFSDPVVSISAHRALPWWNRCLLFDACFPDGPAKALPPDQRRRHDADGGGRAGTESGEQGDEELREVIIFLFRFAPVIGI